METSDYISAGLLTASAILLLVAGALALLRRTWGLPPFQRARAMIGLVGVLTYSQLPSRRAVAEVMAGFGGFIAGGLASAAVCGALVRWYSASLPRYEEAYEGFRGRGAGHDLRPLWANAVRGGRRRVWPRGSVPGERLLWPAGSG